MSYALGVSERTRRCGEAAGSLAKGAVAKKPPTNRMNDGIRNDSQIRGSRWENSKAELDHEITKRKKILSLLAERCVTG
jgi:hypothetical protein